MGKVISVVYSIVLAIIFAGCIRTENHPQIQLEPSITLNTKRITATPMMAPTMLPTIAPTLTPTESATADNEDMIYDTNPLIQKDGSGNEVLNCKNFDLTLIFPKSWSGRYLVAEHEEWLSVFFKPEDLKPITVYGKVYYPLLFTIEQMPDDYDPDEDICDSSLTFEVKGVTYFKCEPTDLEYPTDGPEYDSFSRMMGEIDEIVLSAK